jgi:hypothetical protein
MDCLQLSVAAALPMLSVVLTSVQQLVTPH